MSLRPEGLTAVDKAELRRLRAKRERRTLLANEVNRLSYLEEQERRFSTTPIPKGDPDV